MVNVFSLDLMHLGRSAVLDLSELGSWDLANLNTMEVLMYSVFQAGMC